MGNRSKSQHVRLTCTFIKAHRREVDTVMMCRLLDVSRSGFSHWVRPPHLTPDALYVVTRLYRPTTEHRLGQGHHVCARM